VEGRWRKTHRTLRGSLLFGAGSAGALIVASAAYVSSTGIELNRLAISVLVGLLYIGLAGACMLGYRTRQLSHLQQETRARADRVAATLEQTRVRQEELILAERLAVARQMGVTIQHEINNPLTAVLGNTEWLLGSEKGVSQEGVDALGEIRRAAIRIRDVIRKLDEIETVRTTSFLGDVRMVDLAQSSRASEESPPADG
jgi:signal transduction histidine kinase